MKRFENEERCFIGLDRLDNWKSLQYDKRYLDALASILLVNGNNNTVAAVCYHDNKFYLSYNRTPSKTDKTVLKSVLQDINSKKWKDLLITHLIYNQIDFQGILGTYLGFYKNIPKEIEKKVKEYLASINTPTKATKTGKEAIFDNYFKLLEDVSSSNEPIEEHFKELLFRPLQNVTKLCYFLNNNDVTINTDNLIQLENKKKDLHAELNIKEQFPLLDEKYIGVSRLCCAACHEVLELYQDAHRGTHGVYYDAWEHNIMQFSNVKKSIQDRADTSTNQEFEKSQMNKKEFTTKAKNVLDTRYKVEQQRDLSDDESMESEITITEEVNLWQLKQKLGLGQTKVIEEQESTSWFTPTKIIGLVVAAGVIHTAYKYLDISLSDVFDIDLTGSTCSDVSTIL